MAQQRWIIATLIGQAGQAAAERLSDWQTRPAPVVELDRFAAALRQNAAGNLAVAFYCEWIDRWSMGGLLPRPALVGAVFEACWWTRTQALAWSRQCGEQSPETAIYARRVSEAAEAWKELVPEALVLGLREPLDVTASDEEMLTAAQSVPEWIDCKEGR